MKQAAIEQEKSNRLYQEVRSEKSSSSTKTLIKHSKEQKRFRAKESSQKQGSRDKDSKKRPFEKEWERWGCREKGHYLSDCRKTSKDDKERSVKERSFSKKKLAVLTDPQFGGKTWPSSTTRFGFLTF